MKRAAGNPVDRAKRMLIGIEIPRDELALRIAQPCIGMKAPPGADAGKSLDAMNEITADGLRMGDTFRRAADAAVAYVHECINAGQRAQ